MIRKNVIFDLILYRSSVFIKRFGTQKIMKGKIKLKVRENPTVSLP